MQPDDGSEAEKTTRKSLYFGVNNGNLFYRLFIGLNKLGLPLFLRPYLIFIDVKWLHNLTLINSTGTRPMRRANFSIARFWPAHLLEYE